MNEHVMLYLFRKVLEMFHIFPMIDVVVPVEKGSAAFWFNMNTDSSDMAWMEHASCPVLYGNKWIAGKIPTEFGNEFTRPCGLKPDAPIP
jgi:prolyl 4-hydroxylase